MTGTVEERFWAKVARGGPDEWQCRTCNRERVLRTYHNDVVKSRAIQNERNRLKRASS